MEFTTSAHACQASTCEYTIKGGMNCPEINEH